MLIFCAFTATQLINMYNIKCTFYPECNANIYVELGNRISLSLVKSVEDTGVFKSVIINTSYKLMENNSKNKKYTPLWLKLINISRKTYHNILSQKKIGDIVKCIGGFILGPFLSANYIQQHKSFFQEITNTTNIEAITHIFVGTLGGFGTMFIKQILQKTNEIRVCLVDEGTANYYWDKLKMVLEFTKGNFIDKLLCKYYHLDKDFFDTLLKITNECYLYQPTAYAYQDQYSLKKIPPINENNPKVFSLLKDSVARADIVEYAERHVYYLLQTYNIAFEECLSEILSHVLHIDLLLKEHPWYRVMSCLSMAPDLSSVYVDTRSDAFIFEALLTHIDFSNRVLITEFSSAAFTPKFMFDVEPYVVFLYNIIDAEKPDMIKSCEVQRENLIKLYRNPEKIYAPKSLDELRAVLKEVSSLISPNIPS